MAKNKPSSKSSIKWDKDQVQHRQKRTKPNRDQSTLVFDPKERVEFVTGFSKRKQERKEHAKLKAEEKEREIRRLLRKKRREMRQESSAASESNKLESELE